MAEETPESARCGAPWTAGRWGEWCQRPWPGSCPAGAWRRLRVYGGVEEIDGTVASKNFGDDGFRPERRKKTSVSWSGRLCKVQEDVEED